MDRQIITFLDVTALVLATYLVYSLFSKVRLRQQYTHLPPGPPGLPLVGNLRAPAEPAWATYYSWSKIYDSDVIRLNVLGTNIVVLNSLESATELLDRRSTLYSDRPNTGLTMLSELCGLGWSFALQSYGPEWRDGRKAFQKELSITSIKKFRPAQVREVHKLLVRILRQPEGFWDHTHSMSSSQILSIAYGIDIEDKHDPHVIAAEHAAEAVTAAMNPGSYLVDLFPPLKYLPEWFPGAGFRREARLWRKSVMATRDDTWNYVKRQMNEDPDTVPPSAASNLLKNMVHPAKDPVYMEKVVKSALGSMYLAGSDTTLNIIRSCLLAMVLFPEVLHCAQRSLDEVCKDRLPTFEDYESLPYVHAIIKESLRWNPVVPLNLPHKSTTDATYRGFFIERGSIMVANIKAILHDPEVYPDPEKFSPDRFLRPSAADPSKLELNPNIRDPADVAFGFGRRVCPGRYMAYELLWLSFASLLCVFDFGQSRDEYGNHVAPRVEFQQGFLYHPKPFVCSISPRSPQHAEMILKTSECF